jgi:IPT/TIG domain
MAQSVYIGLAVGGGTSTSPATATFDNVSINPTVSPAPVITSVSATTGSVGSQVEISGSSFGSPQSNSLVLLNDIPLIVNSWSNSQIIVTIPSGATSGPLVVSVAPSMDNSNPVEFTVTSQPLPTSWLDQDVGIVGLAGSATYASGTFTVNGAGNCICGSADAMHFVYQPMSGDGTIVARVAGAQGTYVQPGVMIRETLNANATNAFTFYCPSAGRAEFYWRPSAGANLDSSQGPSASLPYWVKLVRTGNTFSAYVSADGVNWTQGSNWTQWTQTIAMAQNVYVGLVVSSQSTTSLATATFDIT